MLTHSQRLHEARVEGGDDELRPVTCVDLGEQVRDVCL